MTCMRSASRTSSVDQSDQISQIHSIRFMMVDLPPLVYPTRAMRTSLPRFCAVPISVCQCRPAVLQQRNFVEDDTAVRLNLESHLVHAYRYHARWRSGGSTCASVVAAGSDIGPVPPASWRGRSAVRLAKMSRMRWLVQNLYAQARSMFCSCFGDNSSSKMANPMRCSGSSSTDLM